MKKLLVIAVATALIAPAAAMADTTLYGKLHASVGNVDKTLGATSVSGAVVESHNSRFGIKGSTELDNGLSATYGLEYGIDLDGENNGTALAATAAANTTAATAANAATSLTTRNQFVGVKGGFGEVRVGKHDTPAKLATSGLDTFADTYGDMANIIATDGHRPNNAVAYINKFGPVGVAALHSTAFSTNDAVAPSSTTAANTVMANYSSGPYYAGLGFTDIDNVGTTTNLGLGWKADAGHFASMVYENAEGSNTSATDVAGLPGGTAKDTNIYVAGGFKTGAATLKAGYGTSDRDTAGEETLTTVAVDYSLGKKTSAYLMWNENENAPHAVVSTAKTTATVLGIVTDF